MFSAGSGRSNAYNSIQARFRDQEASQAPGEHQEWPECTSNSLGLPSLAFNNYGKVLAYGQSDYVRQFGLAVEPGPLTVHARVLKPPTLKYGPGSRSLTIVSSHYRVRRMSLTTFRPREMVVGTWPTRNSSSL
jgi:hypothetical protein